MTPIQAKLAVASPTDPLEREADRAAAEVVSGLRQEGAAGPAKRLTPSTASADGEGVLQRKCNACADQDDEPNVIRRKVWMGEIEGASPLVAPNGFSEQLREARARGGRGLESPLRGEMERGFASNFSGVRIHDDSRAAELAQQVHARAFTVGDHVFFNRGEFGSRGRAGLTLVAHELAHVVQQRQSADTLVQRSALAAPEADHAAADATVEPASPREEKDNAREQSKSLKQAKRRKLVLEGWLRKLARIEHALERTPLRARWARWVYQLAGAGEIDLDAQPAVVKARLAALSTSGAPAAPDPVEPTDADLAAEKPNELLSLTEETEEQRAPVRFVTDVKPKVNSKLNYKMLEGSAGGPQIPQDEYFTHPAAYPASGGVELSGDFEAEASVRAEGESEAVIAEWDVGFTQTFISDTTQAKYAGAKQKCFTMFQGPFDPVFDGRKDSAPFYHPKAMAAAGSNVLVATNDHPSSIWAWSNRCTKLTDDGSASKWQDGPLRKTCGSYRLVTRLIARHRPTNRIRFLNFVVWEVDFSAEFGDAKKVTPSGGARSVGQGEGKGSEPSELEGADANSLFSARPYDCELALSCKSCTPRKSGK